MSLPPSAFPLPPSPLVSILIACYNAADHLDETLESVLAQTYPHIEVLVCDDGSRDDTLAIARRFEPRGVLVSANERNLGQAGTFNRMLARSTGDYITFFDADDLMHPDKTRLQVEALSRTEGSAMATCEWARFYDDPREARFDPEPLWQDLAPVDWLVRSWQHNEMMHPGSSMIPRHVVEKAGPWNEQLTLINDHEYYCRVMLACRVVKFVPGARTYYRSGIASSVSQRTSATAWRSAFHSLMLSSDALLAVEDSERTRRACATKLQRFIYESYPQVPELREQAARRVAELGGTDLQPEGGPLFRAARRVIGWKGARRLQEAANRLGHRKRGTKKMKIQARRRAGL